MPSATGRRDLFVATPIAIVAGIKLSKAVIRHSATSSLALVTSTSIRRLTRSHSGAVPPFSATAARPTRNQSTGSSGVDPPPTQAAASRLRNQQPGLACTVADRRRQASARRPHNRRRIFREGAVAFAASGTAARTLGAALVLAFHAAMSMAYAA
jgi:hypothetical protein